MTATSQASCRRSFPCFWYIVALRNMLLHVGDVVLKEIVAVDAAEAIGDAHLAPLACSPFLPARA